MKKPHGPRTRSMHEQKDRELERLHRVCRELAIEEAARIEAENIAITALLRPAREEARR
jgi:hypothetical protein